MGTSPKRHLPCHSSLFVIPKATYFLFVPLALLNLYLFFPSPPNDRQPQQRITAVSSPHPSSNFQTQLSDKAKEQKQSPAVPIPCDYADGRWVPKPGGPTYDDTSCTTIKSGQNCMAHGRPDTGYLHWRWQPAACSLPAFSAADFLRLLANKHLSFVGDSLARNQIESLLCLVASHTGPPDLVYRREQDKFRRWVFRSHNATVSIYWSPFLVNGTEQSPTEGRVQNHMHLDAADGRWAAEVGEMDVLVISAGHWFLLPTVFYTGGEVVGCHHCGGLNRSESGFFEAFRRAVRTAVGAAVGGMAEGGMTVVATFSPAHFEGEWDKAGACSKVEPFREGEKEMEYMDREMRRIGVEEVAAAAAAVERVRVEVLDVTGMAMMRPDGHPGPYMHERPFEGGAKERVQNDCVHWCLPGPIDAWNEVLLELLKRWREAEGEGEVSAS